MGALRDDNNKILPAGNMKGYLGKKEVAYSGELGGKWRPLSWIQVEPSLPPADRFAAIPAESLCEGGDAGLCVAARKVFHGSR